MRTQNSKKSAITALISNIIRILLGFFSQKIFLMYLGKEILGLNGLFNNIISMLAITELGIGTAIIYSLYDPIAKDDKSKIKKLVEFYQKAYRIITCVILVFGILVIPFLPMLAKENIDGMIIYYLLFLFDILISYSVAHKISLINAYQKNYITNIIHLIYLVFMNVLQIVVLFVFKDYLSYLIIKVVSRILENILVSYVYKKDYAWLKNVESKELDKETKNDIVKKVKALFLHKISAFIVTGTDNMIISRIFGLVTVGLYSNYCMIINSIQSLFSQMFNSIVSSIGNLLTEKDPDKSYGIYKVSFLINYLIISFCSICLFFMIEPFISVWLGDEYLLSTEVLLVLILVFYSNGMRNAPSAFKSGAGIFVEDRFVPFIESAINLVVSIVLALKVGLIGVFIGTLASSLLLHLYSYPKLVYKKLFNRSYFGYIKEQSIFFLLAIFNFMVVFVITRFINFDSSWLNLIFNGCICLILPNVINLIILFRTNEFKFLLNKFNIIKTKN